MVSTDLLCGALTINPTVLTPKSIKRRTRRTNYAAQSPQITQKWRNYAVDSALQTLTPSDPATDAASFHATADPSLQVTEWLVDTYNISDRRLIVRKVQRAEAAMQTYNPSKTHLDLDTDILPKFQFLDTLAPGLGYKVFSRYPEEFVHPDAMDYWTIMAAYLYTNLGYTEDRITVLFKRHMCLFARTVQDPSNLKNLFEWFRDIGLSGADVARLVDKHPLLLQADVATVIEPRIQFMLDLGLTTIQVVKAIKRVPELLGVDSSVLQQPVAYLEELGLSRGSIAKLFASQPAIFACSVETKLAPIVDLLKTELGCEDAMLLRMVAQSGLLSRSPSTIRSRAAFWRDDLQFGPDGLRQALQRFPRLLLYPMDQDKYQKKIQFLIEELELSPINLISFPQYVSYSLYQRIGPRAAAVRQLVPGQSLVLTRLALADDAFYASYGIGEETYAAFVAKWQASEEGLKWHDA